MSSRQSLIRLTCEALRCKLSEVHLTTTGNKAAFMERLLQHEASYVQGPSGISSRSTGHANHLTSSDSGNKCLANSSDDSSERGSEEQLASDEVLEHTSPVFSAQ